MRLVLLEIVDEHANELQRLLIIGGGIGPGAPRIEQFRIDARAGDRNLEAEIRVGAELRIRQLALERGAEQTTSRVDRHARADAIATAGPAVFTSQQVLPCSAIFSRSRLP